MAQKMKGSVRERQMILTEENGKHFTVCAHRGFSARYPENSIEAFEGAVACGADEIELDVRLTADGVMIVSHDNRLDRISDGLPGETVSGSEFGYLRGLNTGAKRVMTARFCTPEEVFAAVGGRIIMNIHLKESGPDGCIIRGLAGLAGRYGIADSVYFAGSPAELDAMRKYAPHIPRTAIQLPRDTVGIADMAAEYGCFRVQLWSGLYTAGDIDLLKSRGVHINLFHAETEEEVTAAFAEGVDTVLSNNADVAVAAAEKMRGRA